LIFNFLKAFFSLPACLSCSAGSLFLLIFRFRFFQPVVPSTLDLCYTPEHQSII
jgi:hypothetical protein